MPLKKTYVTRTCLTLHAPRWYENRSTSSVPAPRESSTTCNMCDSTRRLHPNGELSQQTLETLIASLLPFSPFSLKPLHIRGAWCINWRYYNKHFNLSLLLFYFSPPFSLQPLLIRGAWCINWRYYNKHWNVSLLLLYFSPPFSLQPLHISFVCRSFSWKRCSPHGKSTSCFLSTNIPTPFYRLVILLLRPSIPPSSLFAEPSPPNDSSCLNNCL